MLKLFMIEDTKSGTFKPPYIFKNSVEAGRAIQQALSDDKTDLAKYPRDFHLWEIGEFNPDTGVLKAYKAPKSINAVSDFLVEDVA